MGCHLRWQPTCIAESLGPAESLGVAGPLAMAGHACGVVRCARTGGCCPSRPLTPTVTSTMVTVFLLLLPPGKPKIKKDGAPAKDKDRRIRRTVVFTGPDNQPKRKEVK